MKSLLEALEVGRLIELPDSDKISALELLAHLLEATPAIGTHADLLKSVIQRENQANTALGKGIACPHCRTSNDSDLLCAVGWSPAGIEYSAPDGKKVHLVIMYYVPDSQRNAYLKEVSGLAKAITLTKEDIETIASLKDIHQVREKLLDWVTILAPISNPDGIARMIKLEARHALAAEEAIHTNIVGKSIEGKFYPFKLITWDKGQLALTKDPELAKVLESFANLNSIFANNSEFDIPPYKLAIFSESSFALDKREYSGVAFKNKSL